MYLRLIPLVILLSGLFAFQICAQEREQFIRELTQELLACEKPGDTESSEGWQGVVLARHAIPNFEELYREYSRSEELREEIVRSFEVVDRPLSIKEGVAVYGDSTISTIWRDMIPRMSSGESNATRIGPELYLEGDRVSIQRGVFEVPTVQYSKFRKYRSSFSSILRSVLEENDSWRLNGNLAQFSSVAEALSTTFREWELFGYKSEVAITRISSQLNRDRVMESLELLQEFGVGPYQRQKLMKSWLSPPPDTWRDTRLWRKVRSVTFGGSGYVEFEIARIRIIRPWFNIDDLVRGNLTMASSWALANPGFVFSEGKAPDIMDYPTGGVLNIYAEELLLVRNIRFDEKVGKDPKHPLDFSYTDTNLLGYVVRVLPRIASTVNH